MKSIKQIREASGGKEAYMKFFNSLLKKFGVDSPSELSGDKKKKFFNAVDKGWEGDDPSDANEHTIYLATQLTERLRAGRGKLVGKKALDVDMDASDYPGGERKYMADMKKKFKVSIKMTSVGADITGTKADILKFIQSDYYGMDDSDIKALFPELLENKDDFKDDTDVEDDRGNYSGVEEDHSLSHDDEDDEDMDDLDPDTTTDLQGEDYYDSKQEKAPPGMEDFVEKLKADGMTDEQAFKIAWSQYNDAKRTKTRHGDAEHESVEEAKWGPAKKGKTIRGAKLGKSYPVMDAGQKSKVQAIAKKNSGNMAQAMIDIEKIRGGLTDNPDVMEILRLANESVEEAKVKPVQGNKKEYWRRVDAVRKKFGILGKEGGILNLNKAQQKKYFAAVNAALGHTEDLDLQRTGDAGTSKSVNEKVSVDRRTKGFKEAMIRKEKAKAKREAKKAAAAKTPKFNTDAHIDKGNYEYDGEVDEVLSRTNNMVMYGKRTEDAAANAVAHAGVDMAPNAKPKKKKLSDIYKR